MEENLKDSRILEYDRKLTLSDVNKFAKVREESIRIKKAAFDAYNSMGFNNPMFYEDIDNNEEVNEKKNKKWHNVIPSSFLTINNNCNCGGYQLGSVNLFAAPYSINKIPFMVNEGINALNHGYYVFHLFLDNNSVCNGMIFYVSCMTKISQKELDPYLNPIIFQIILN